MQYIENLYVVEFVGEGIAAAMAAIVAGYEYEF